MAHHLVMSGPVSILAQSIAVMLDFGDLRFGDRKYEKMGDEG